MQLKRSQKTTLMEVQMPEMKKMKEKTNATGDFQKLPTEIVFHIFARTNVRQLASLSLSSHAVRDLIETYTMRADTRIRFVKETGDVASKHRYTDMDAFGNWGALFKAVTCAYPTSQRIRILEAFYVKNSAVKDEAGWGRLLMAMTASWDFCECARVLQAALLYDGGRLQTLLDRVLGDPIGARQQEAMKLRRLLRASFLDHTFGDVRDRPFWTSAVLRTRKTLVEQAHLLAILYAPTRHDNNNNVEIDFKSLCDMAVTTMADGVTRVQPLADALDALLQTGKHKIANYDWCDHDVFALVEEVTTMPEPWALDNFAALLLMRPSLTPVALVSRCVHNYEHEAGQIVNVMKTLAFRWRMSPTAMLVAPLMATMHGIPLIKDRRSLFESIQSAHGNRVTDLIYDNSLHSRRDLMEEMNATAYWGSMLSMLIALI